MADKYIFVTGGVVSSLGKGVASASLAAILELSGIKVTLMKFDPYLNVDPGTMNPFQHGEVFVTEDGGETDLDLGYYERFVSTKMSRDNNVTSGQIYDAVISKERKGDYLGATVQIIPHVTNEIKQRIFKVTKDFEIAIIEIGGTIGDIESLPFLEAIRQIRMEQGASNTLFMHLTLVPYVATAGEFKTKPTQHSVKELRSIGIQPDVLICRGEKRLHAAEVNKIALFTNVTREAVISCMDVQTIFSLPIELQQQKLDKIVLDKLSIQAKEADLAVWHEVVRKQQSCDNEVTVAMVGKYMGLSDVYKSINEALVHAGIANQVKVNIDYVDAETLEQGDNSVLKAAHAILIPGGFGKRGIEGKIQASKFARMNQVPFLGICLGMQVAVIDIARNVLKMTDANSTEFASELNYPVIALVTEWTTSGGATESRNLNSDLGGTMRLGAQQCNLIADSMASKLYGKKVIFERHRHRYEVNEKFVDKLSEKIAIVGRSQDNLVEVIELPEHKWFIACQFHPEFTSKPIDGHPLFNGLVKAAVEYKDN